MYLVGFIIRTEPQVEKKYIIKCNKNISDYISSYTKAELFKIL